MQNSEKIKINICFTYAGFFLVMIGALPLRKPLFPIFFFLMISSKLNAVESMSAWYFSIFVQRRNVIFFFC